MYMKSPDRQSWRVPPISEYGTVPEIVNYFGGYQYFASDNTKLRGGLQTTQFKTGLAQIAACEAQHSSYFTARSGGKAFWLSFPPALTIQQASDAMAGYTA